MDIGHHSETGELHAELRELSNNARCSSETWEVSHSQSTSSMCRPVISSLLPSHTYVILVFLSLCCFVVLLYVHEDDSKVVFRIPIIKPR